MLATGRLQHWRSRSYDYIDTRPDGEALRKSILQRSLPLQRLSQQVVLQQMDSPAVPEQSTVETIINMTPKNELHFESEKEAIHLILTELEMKYTQLLMHV
ncbi:hypothetical protein Tco_1237083 [Tanacetum coccineum]